MNQIDIKISRNGNQKSYKLKGLYLKEHVFVKVLWYLAIDYFVHAKM